MREQSTATRLYEGEARRSECSSRANSVSVIGSFKQGGSGLYTLFNVYKYLYFNKNYIVMLYYTRISALVLHSYIYSVFSVRSRPVVHSHHIFLLRFPIPSRPLSHLSTLTLRCTVGFYNSISCEQYATLLKLFKFLRSVK